MFRVSASCGHLKAHQAATPVLIGSARLVPEGRRSTRVSRHFVWVAKALSFCRLCLAQTLQFSLALGVVPLRLVSVPAQRWRSLRCPAQVAGSVSSGACGGSSTALRSAAVAHGMHRLSFSTPAWYRACFTPCASNSRRKTMSHHNRHPNPALNPAPFGRWTLRDKAAQRRLALRYVLVRPKC